VDDGAVAWAETVLDEPVVEVAELSGGLTSTMLALTHGSGARSVLRLMTNEPWRTHGAELTRRERATQTELSSTAVPAPVSLGIDADGVATGVAAHLMSRLPGVPTAGVDDAAVVAMAEMLALIHDVRPTEPFRAYQSWAWEAKYVVPAWTHHPAAWLRAFDILAEEPPAFEPTFLHRDFSHRNLLWRDGRISGVVDWVETSTGPAWLDAAHAATNLAIAHGPASATAFLAAYAALTGTRPAPYWMVMDTVGFLPPPGRPPFFSSAVDLGRLDQWLVHVVAAHGRP
jgi:aminoglycoside phosphotransferase (APT) family kinase protein